MLGLVTIASVLLLAQVTQPSRSVRSVYSGLSPRLFNQQCDDDSVGKFVKDRYACDKFFYCAAKAVGILVNCPLGMVFNDRKEICDFPWNYHCIAEEPPPPLPSPESTTEAHDQTSTTKPTEPPSAPPTVTINPCPRDDTDSIVFLPDIADCHRYYICYHGYPHPQDCIHELNWNQQMKRCDLPANAHCPLTSTTAAPQSSTTVMARVPTVITCPFRGEQIFPHPGECNYFIYCINGYATVQQCPFFHYFDVNRRTCMWRTLAKCVTKM